jgi:hypothetical protein
MRGSLFETIYHEALPKIKKRPDQASLKVIAFGE